MEVAAKCLFPQKLGPNPLEMEVRTFVSITKVIWNQVTCRLLRLKLSRINFVNLYMYVIKATVNKYEIIISLSHCLALFLFCSP